MKKLALLFVVVVASCGPSKEKQDEIRNAEIRKNIHANDSIVCFTLGLSDTTLYK